MLTEQIDATGCNGLALALRIRLKFLKDLVVDGGG